MLQKVEICGVNTSGLPLLTAEDNERLMKQIKEGDEKAREELMKIIKEKINNLK